MTTTDMPELNSEPDGFDDRSSVALFSGDSGGLSFDERRCLVRLLKDRYLSKDTHPDLWEVLVRHEDTLRARLNDLFLTLQIDRQSEVAYKRQAVPDDGERRFPTLLHDTAYSREETILLVYLRERAHRERASGAESVLVDRDELEERISEFRHPETTDLAGESRRASNAIDALKTMGVLHATSDSDRFAVSPVLDALMPLPRLKELLEWLRSEVRVPADDQRRSDQACLDDDRSELQ